MAGKNVTQVQTPGAAAPAPADTAARAPADANEALIDGAAPLEGGLPPDLQAKVDAAIERGVAARLARLAPTAAATKPAAVVQRAYDEVVAEQLALPEDQRKPSLTDIGWYVPPGYGRNPNAPRG